MIKAKRENTHSVRKVVGWIQRRFFQIRRLLCIAALQKSGGEIKTACNKKCH